MLPYYQMQLGIPGGMTFTPADAHSMVAKLVTIAGQASPHIFDIMYLQPASNSSGAVLTLRATVVPSLFAGTAEPVDVPPAGQEIGFHLHARASRRAAGQKRRPLVLNEWRDWLGRKSAGCGFEVRSLTVTPTRRFVGGKHPFNLDGAILAGTLIVQDPIKLYTALTLGIGNGRRFGWGLLRLQDGMVAAARTPGAEQRQQ